MPQIADKKFGRFSEEIIRAAVARDREAAAAATDGWRHTHGCVIDCNGTILTNVGGQQNLYKADSALDKDPANRLANARFMVNARGNVERRCDMIEALLAHIEKLEAR